MPSSELPKNPEKSGKVVPYPYGASFAELLRWHFQNGTRPRGRGATWTPKVFANAIYGFSESENSTRTVRNWLKGTRPNDLESIERELFGGSSAYSDWRADLRRAYHELRAPVDEAEDFPRPSAHFLGRSDDVAAILKALSANSPAILVQGPPGIGKTSLTKALADHEEAVAKFGETHRWFVELENAGTNVALQDAITRKLGGDPKNGFKAGLAFLRKTPGLLVLDNLETPWEPLAERAKTEETLQALAAIPGLALVASFRGRERVAGPKWALVHWVEQLKAPFDAELFCAIAQNDYTNDPHFRLFLDALGGVPLAIELVAARAFGHESLAELWAQWLEIGAGFAAHPDHPASRLTSLPHSIELSLRSPRLTPDSLRLFRWLGQLPAGVITEDRDALLGGNGFDAEDRLRRTDLATKRGARLELLAPVREYARRAHAPHAPDDGAWRGHYLDLTRTRGEAIGTLAGDGAVARLEPEYPNVVAAIRAALSVKKRVDVMVALLGFVRLTEVAALPAPVLEELADACHDEGEVLHEANCIKILGNIALRRSEHDVARKAYKTAVRLYRNVGDILGEANCIASIGDIALQRSNYDAARKAYQDAMPLYQKVGDILGEANCIRRLGDIALERSEHDVARKAFHDAMTLYQKIGQLLGEANCIAKLGEIALARSEHGPARKAYLDAMTLFRKVGDLLGEANCIQGLGDIAVALSEHNDAREAYEEAMPLYRKVGHFLGEANCLVGLGKVALARSEHGDACNAFKKALPLYRKYGCQSGEAYCVLQLAALKGKC